MLSIKDKLIQKIGRESPFSPAIVENHQLHSFRRQPGLYQVAWSTVGLQPNYKSFATMTECVNLPVKFVKHYGEIDITVEIDFDKVMEMQPCPQS